MNEHSVLKFFNQLVKEIKKGQKRFGIITDKDGTLLLNDELRQSLKAFNAEEHESHIYIIANTGRTIQDMINCLERGNIALNYFDYIVGDNGGICFDVANNKQLFKHILDKKAIDTVVQQFTKGGGRKQDIRFTDGNNIFAYPSEAVRSYYNKNKEVVYKENISDLEGIDATKLTFVASHEQIDKLKEYVRENLPGYRTHIGKTKFPGESINEYRLDFTGAHTKGSALEILRGKLGLDVCVCLGNDLNDITMFSNALKHDDFIVVAKNEDESITEMIIKYLQQETELRGKNWEDVKFLVLGNQNVNRFLTRVSVVMKLANKVKHKKTEQMANRVTNGELYEEDLGI